MADVLGLGEFVLSGGANLAEGEGLDEGVSAGGVRGLGETVLSSSGLIFAEGDGRAEKEGEGGGGTLSLGFGEILAFGEVAGGLPPVVGAGELFAVAVGAGLFLNE